MPDEIFVAPTWLNFGQGATTHNFLDLDLLARSYKMWRHAESKLTSDAHDLDLADAILWLNRAVSLRVKSLFKQYDLRTIGRSLGMNRASHSEIMAEVGLIRPRMLRELTVLRNAVEHEDAAPPTLQRCQEFSEFVWYFLRSTDDIARMKLLNLELNAYSDAGTVMLDFETRDAKLPIYGRLSIEQASWTRRDDWTSIELTQKPRIKSKMVIFHGIVRGPRESLTRIWKRCFKLDDNYV